MANSLSILSDGGRVRTFACPVCRQTIALGCERCRFCSVVIDQRSAEAAADLMDRVNLACSEAEDIRALLSWPKQDFDIALRPGNRYDVYLAPIFLIRWWIRFGSLHVEDEDLIRARKDLKTYSLYAFAVLIIVLFLACLPTLRW